MNLLKQLFSRGRTSAPQSEWDMLRKKYAFPIAPNVELAKTKQELVVCCASVLDRIWNGNGGMGWDESCEADFVAPLREMLTVDQLFSEAQRAAIQRSLHEIVLVGRQNIAEEKKGVEGWSYEPAGSQVSVVVQHVMEWCRHYPDPISLGVEDDYHGHESASRLKNHTPAFFPTST